MMKGGDSMKKRIWILLGMVVILSFMLAGCYKSSAVKERVAASQMLSELRNAEGANLVPYEYTSAEKYLEVSDREFNEGDYKHSMNFAIQSKSIAESALAGIKK
jgi:hypothetical protein